MQRQNTINTCQIVQSLYLTHTHHHQTRRCQTQADGSFVTGPQATAATSQSVYLLLQYLS